MKISESIKELSTALSKFQGEVKNPHNEATNPQYKSKYAPLDVVINTIKPLLSKHGLSFIQSTSTEGESVGITTLLLHESGEWIESDTMFLPAYQLKGGGVKEFNAQGIGSSTTYGRRYQLSAMLGLSSEDDDDANGQVFGGNDSGNKGKTANTDKARGTSATTAQPSARDKAIADAKAKAEAKTAAEKVESKNEPLKDGELPFSLTEPDVIVEAGTAPISEQVVEAGVEPINKAQLGAIGNMLKLVSKKKGDGFNPDEYIIGLAKAKGKNTLEELTFVQGKEIVMELNTEMRK